MFKEALFSGIIRKMETLQTVNDKPCIKVHLPENRIKDGVESTTWYTLVFWGKQAEFAAKNFRSGTVITARCSIQLNRDHKVSFHVRECTPINNWGSATGAEKA